MLIALTREEGQSKSSTRHELLVQSCENGETFLRRTFDSEWLADVFLETLRRHIELFEATKRE